ncbi:MAG: hypothetical protein UR99_C0017G0025 [Candidatus Moranbacteria bacterium GW2011_GWD2_36_12]|nr:MAG: hypothetical protein UR99_C0017G0025 [Candidatus Moranbacteria bacterium GW2011_GWD2_36_12]
MIELSQQRNYNSKTFLHDTEVGKKVLQSHAGHIHYKDGADFKEISWDLIWDEVKRGWGFTTHSFNPFLPEYSDGFVEFRDRFQDKDQTIKYRAVCDKVKGELIETDETNPNFDNNPDNKGVLYKDAFGKGKDYLLYHTRSSLVKVATVNNPNEQTEDVKFRWEIQLPNKDVYRAESKEIVEKSIKDNEFEVIKDGKTLSYKLDVTKAKAFDSDKQTLIGDTQNDGKEWFTYLKSFRAWDSKGNKIIVGARIFQENGKTYLEKTIPLDFLKKAEGRVFTDTTTTYYPTVDGIVAQYYTTGTNAYSLAQLRSGVGNTVWDTDASIYIFGITSDVNSAYYRYIMRSIFIFDTSSLTSGASISSASFKFYGNAKLNEGSMWSSAALNLYSAAPASETALAAGDYDSLGSSAYCDTEISYSSFSITGYNTFSLNSTGISAISKTGKTKIGARETYYDLGGNSPTWSTDKAVHVDGYFSEQTGTDKDPYLEVTYTTGTAYTKSITEASTYSDTVTKKQTAKRITEASTYTSVVAKLIGKRNTESSTWTDTVASIYALAKAITESLTWTDLLTKKQTGKRIAEVSTSTDSLNILKTIGKYFLESATYTDTVAKIKTLFKTLTETATYTDVVSRGAIMIGRLLQESIAWLDRLYGKKNGVNMKYVKKYAEKVGTYIKKYFDI